MKKIDLALLIGLITALVFSNITAFADNCEDLRHTVLRLHILANSDSDEDQALKYAVRDRLLEESRDLFIPGESLDDAEASAQENIARIESIAAEVIAEHGADYEVSAQLTNMYFTTRVYENLTMPAGYYDALRITIGEGAGHNWWCVLFPPLCIPAAMEEEEKDEKFTPEQRDLMENGSRYKVQFKLVEWFEGLKHDDEEQEQDQAPEEQDEPEETEPEVKAQFKISRAFDWAGNLFR